tara:strand:+ start:3063 stop:3482 length:420 start_codon:yes stop_codon:yes gene_type:complete
MQDIILIGTLMTILTSIYMVPIASLHNTPKEYTNRLFCILIPEVVILVCLHILLLQVYHFMEHHQTPAVYIAFGIVIVQIALVYSALFNHWGLRKGEVEKAAVSNSTTSLLPAFDLMLASGLIHLTSLFIVLGALTVIT